jgi:hypothetical protein
MKIAAKLMESTLAFARAKDVRIAVDDFVSVLSRAVQNFFPFPHNFCIWVSLLTSCT